MNWIAKVCRPDAKNSGERWNGLNSGSDTFLRSWVGPGEGIWYIWTPTIKCWAMSTDLELKTFKINHCSTLFITESAFVGNTLFDVSIAQGLSWLWLTLVIESTLVIFNTFLLLSILIFELEWVAKEPRSRWPIGGMEEGASQSTPAGARVNSCRTNQVHVNFWCPSSC